MDFQLTDLKLKLNDLMGLPLNTAIDLDPSVGEVQESCPREECVATAKDSHPEIRAARAEVEKAVAAVRLAKTDIWLPDVDAFGRYSYQNNVPFLAHNFGTFGVHFSYDLFDAGHKRAVLHERESQLSGAKENLAKVTDEVELQVQTAYNKVERTQQMLKVSEEILTLRHESNRVQQQELLRGAALNVASRRGERSRSSTPRLSFCNHSWIMHAHTMSSCVRWAELQSEWLRS